jgi:hypothetical protein
MQKLRSTLHTTNISDKTKITSEMGKNVSNGCKKRGNLKKYKPYALTSRRERYRGRRRSVLTEQFNF